MEEAPDAAQELDRVARKLIFVQRTDTRIAAIAGQLAHPKRRMVIAQAARGFLYVRLQMEDGVAVAGQAFAGKPLEFGKQQRPGLFLGSEQNLGVQFIQELRVRVQKAAIEHGEMEFRI